MLMLRKKQKMLNLAKLSAFLLFGAIIFTPKDLDLSAIAEFNPLVTQAQASSL